MTSEIKLSVAIAPSPQWIMSVLSRSRLLSESSTYSDYSHTAQLNTWTADAMTWPAAALASTDLIPAYLCFNYSLLPVVDRTSFLLDIPWTFLNRHSAPPAVDDIIASVPCVSFLLDDSYNPLQFSAVVNGRSTTIVCLSLLSIYPSICYCRSLVVPRLQI